MIVESITKNSLAEVAAAGVGDAIEPCDAISPKHLPRKRLLLFYFPLPAPLAGGGDAPQTLPPNFLPRKTVLWCE